MKRTLFGCVVLTLVAPALRAQSDPGRGRVSLPLADYLALVERVESAEQASLAAARRSEPPVAELVSQSVAIVWPDSEQAAADVTARFEVSLEGDRAKPVRLPVTGLAWSAEVEPPSGASFRMTGDGLELVASDLGRYRVSVRSRVEIVQKLGTSYLHVAPMGAPVGGLELDLQDALRFHVDGAVMAGESVRDGRRRVSFAVSEGDGATIEVWKDVDGEERDKVLADAALATIVELNEDGGLRHDVVRYRVSRGVLSRFELTLPPGLTPRRLLTDEGEAPLLVDAGVLRVNRAEKLAGEGYLLLTSGLPRLERIPLDVVEPAVPLRERFLILSSSIAARLTPLPETSFQRVDLVDVPSLLRSSADVEAHAAWRLNDVRQPLALRVDPLASPRAIESVVRERSSLSLLTTEGTLVHRDTFTIRTSATTFEVKLPSDAMLWSARVNSAWVRAVERDGVVIVPIGFGDRADHVVEIVSVGSRNLPEGRSRLELDLGEVSPPVLQHRWRLMLPEEKAYRYAGGELRPVVDRARPALAAEEDFRSGRTTAPSILGPGGPSGIRARVMDGTGGILPGAIVTLTNAHTGWTATATANEEGRVWFASLPSGRYTLEAALAGFATKTYEDVPLEYGETPAYAIRLRVAGVEETVTVTGETPVIDTRSPGITHTFGTGGSTGRGGGSVARREEPSSEAWYRSEAEALRQGLASGVKPVPVNIPEQGKLLVLAAALPPERVRVTLEMKPE